jgi:hypothetical protein
MPVEMKQSWQVPDIRAVVFHVEGHVSHDENIPIGAMAL